MLLSYPAGVIIRVSWNPAPNHSKAWIRSPPRKIDTSLDENTKWSLQAAPLRTTVLVKSSAVFHVISGEARSTAP